MIKTTAAAALLGFALLPQTANAEWVEASSEHFLVYGDMDQEQAQTWAERLERLDHFLREATGSKVETEKPKQVTVYVVQSMDDVQRLHGGGGNVGGFYRADAQGALAVTPRKIDSIYKIRPQQVLFHEYTHHLLMSSTAGIYPGWVHEAFAEFFGTAYSDDDGNLVIGAPPLDRGYTLMQQYKMTVEELLTSSSRKMAPDEVPHMYARGWLLLHYMLMSNKRSGQIGEYLSLVGRGTPSLEAGKKAFGDLRKLDSELSAYLRGGKFAFAKIPAKDIVVGPVSVRALRECEARIMPVRMRSAAGVNDKTAADVAAVARKAAAGCENDPFVARTLAETEFDAKNNDAAIAAADRALASDGKNVMSMIYKGRAFARKGNWVEARKWYVRANRTDAEYALPLVLYYDSFTRAGEKPSKSAFNGLLRAAVLVPQDQTVRLRVVRAMLVDGDVNGAREILAPIAFAPHQNTDSPVRKLFDQMKPGANAATILAEADKLKWNELGNE